MYCMRFLRSDTFAYTNQPGQVFIVGTRPKEDSGVEFEWTVANL